MASRRLFGAKPLSEPMLTNCQFNPKDISVKCANIFIEEKVSENGLPR